MNKPQHLQLSIDAVFAMFSTSHSQTLSKNDIQQMLNFVFAQLGKSREANQEDVSQFCQSQKLNEPLEFISKEDFPEDQKFLFFRHRAALKPSEENPENHDPPMQGTQNQDASTESELSIPIQPLLSSCSNPNGEISFEQVRQFLVYVHECLNVPKPVEDGDVQKFISDFGSEGSLTINHVAGIESLKFKVTKGRKYQ